ncbi:MAG TPA: acyl-CoA dehydrogenase family protein, partial [Candidatus Dormibacteraeota bacterium]|nr:acyl-CoA dehydrogenase family protein [Candidatus Dormibacteraeota bacterium]
WENDAVRQRFARCLVELRRIEALCALHGDGRRNREESAEATMVLKAAIAESVELILGECVQLRGADAFREGGEAALRAEAAMFGIAGGATGAMLSGIADHAAALLGAAE